MEGAADLNQELKILLNLIKKNGREGWGGLYNLKKINLKKKDGVSEGAGFNQELKILFNLKQRT